MFGSYTVDDVLLQFEKLKDRLGKVIDNNRALLMHHEEQARIHDQKVLQYEKEIDRAAVVRKRLSELVVGFGG